MFLIILFIGLCCFAMFIAFRAPYLPTLKQQQKSALELLDLKPGQLLFDPGCGDGRVLLAAAKKGIKGFGCELNPLIYIIAKIVTWRYRKIIKIRYGSIWRIKWPQADGIYVFMLQSYMSKLHKKIILLNKNTKVVSYTFKIPEKRPVKQSNGLFLYEYLADKKR